MYFKIKKNYFLLISTFLIIYFIFNLLDGERGLFSYFKKTTLLNNLKEEKKELEGRIENIQFKNLLLTDNLDLDYIEILIRKKFLFGNKGETLYIVKSHEN